jgi:hypothetical protein
MSRSRVVSSFSITFALALLAAVCAQAGAQQSRDARLTVSATVLAAAPRVDHAEVIATTSRATGMLEREVSALVTANSAGESILSIVPRVGGVSVEIIGLDGQATPVSAAGIRVARTTAGRELSAPVLLRIRADSQQLLDEAVTAPVSLLVESAAR